ncbi:hypothetical protein QYF36_027229 [Acer negundo]|nr:hypothetical protein QYF36_027229 [Acer negundo]
MLSHSIFCSRLNIGGTLVSGIWSPRHNKRWWNFVCNGCRVIVAGFLLPDDQPVVGVLPQPWSESSMFFWNGEFKMCYLTLTGSFADMILLPNAGANGTYKAGTFVLSSLESGQLHLYDDASLSTIFLRCGISRVDTYSRSCNDSGKV